MARVEAAPRALDVIVELQRLRTNVQPEVRAWVDVGPGANLSSEAEIELKLSGEWVWTGRVEVETSASQLFYRLGVRANADAEWSIRVHDRALGRDLVADGDALGLDKSWLVGSCQLRAPATRTGTRLRLA